MPKKPLKLATWNINSVRLRIDLVCDFLESHKPDILCLQEIKCENDAFPAKAFRKLGYEHQAVHGQKGYHGVATISKRPLTEKHTHDYCRMGDSRHLATLFDSALGPVRLHNFYVPAGGDEPDVTKNPKFDHKLKFLAEMHDISADDGGIPAILVGDLNIAPLETDVWSHKQLLKVVSHTPIETDGLNAVQAKGGWVDLMRQHVPPQEKIFTWWSYRSPNWAETDRGRRLDHIWASPKIAPKLTNLTVLKEARGWDRPSDHVPVIAELDIA